MPKGVFDNRSTQVVFNDYLPSVVAPWMAMERTADQMCAGAGSTVTDMQRIHGIGWQLKSYMYDPGDVAHLSAAAPGHMSVSNGATVATYFQEEDSFTQQTLTGVSYGGGVVSSGGPVITAKVPAGGDRSTNRLSADELAFPSPDPATDPVDMDRIYKFTGLDPWDALYFGIFIPESAIGLRGTVATILFKGPPGVGAEAKDDVSQEGTGDYGLKVRADGRATLWELNVAGDWMLRYSFLWITSSAVADTWIVLTIAPRMWQNAIGEFLGDRIVFAAHSTTNPIDQLISDISNVAVRGSRAMAKQSPSYNVPRLRKKALTSGTTSTVRVDLARDCRATFSVKRHVYRESGVLIDDYFATEQRVTPDQTIFVYLEGVVPGNTAFSIEVQDQTGAALASASALTVLDTPNGQTVTQAFTPPTPVSAGDWTSHVRLKVTATTTNVLRTPTIFRYGMYRSPQYTEENPLDLVYVPDAEAPPALPKTTVDSVSIAPQEADPGAENASVVVWDLTGDLAFLGERHMVPILIRTRYATPAEEAAAGHELWADLFRGYVLTATGERMRYPAEHVYPAPNATRYSLQCVGEWARTAETLMPVNKVWGTNPTTGAVWDVTDVIRFLGELTYPPEMVDVPDIAVPLLTDDSTAYVQEANARTVDPMHDLAQDYLGSYILFDEAAGDKGELRLLQQKAAPYNNLAVFEIQHPTELAGDSLPRLPHFAGSYPTTTADNDQVVQHTFIKASTYSHYLEKAEGNCVVVYGSAVGNDSNAAGGGDGALLVQVAVNVGSYNFLGLNPGDDGYPDGSSPEFYNRVVPIRVVDWKLGSQKAVDWKCRRIYEKACFSRFFLSFEAPMLLVTDVTDTEQQRPRRLRFYDAVQVRDLDGTLRQFLVISCAPSYTKDHVQMARYLLVTQGNIDTIGAIDRSGSGLKRMLKAFARINGTNYAFAGPSSSQNRQADHLAGQLMALPTPTSDPIQDLDPSSPTFGEFVGDNMDAFADIPTLSV